MEGPKSTGKPPTTMSLTGTVFPWQKGQPVLLGMPGTTKLFLACFSTADKLWAFMVQSGILFETIKLVQEEREFMSSFEGTNIVIILNPWYTPEGRVRFTQVLGEN